MPRHHHRHAAQTLTLTTLVLTGTAGAPHALAQSAAGDAATHVAPVVVSGTRTETSVSEIARSVTVVDRAEIEEQAKVSRSLGDILAQTVPGLGPSTETVTNFAQTLRGRKFLVLIDGIPQSTPLRDASRGLNTISPASIERIEVVRGGTAAYGFGATGGVVNIITKQASDKPVEVYSQVGTRFSTTHFDDSADSETTHRISGDQGAWDYVLSGSFVERGGRFDANGDRIPPDPLANQGGFADTTEYSLLAKAGFDFDGGDQRIELMLNHYENEQDTDYTFGSSLEDGRTPAVELDEAPANVSPENPGTENTTARVSYSHRDLAGSEVDASAYYGNQRLVFPLFPGFPPQSGNDSQKFGARTTIDTPLDALVSGSRLTWGADYLHDDLDRVAFADSGNPQPQSPPLEQDAIAGFGQLEIPTGDFGLIRGGLRYEQIDVAVDSILNANNNRVQDGELNFDELLFNAGVVIFASERVDLFANYSQGFSLADIGRTLRTAGPDHFFTPGVFTVDPEDFESEAKVVDNYEIGARYFSGALTASAAVFYSESENGGTFNDDLELERSDEEVWGIEGEFRYQATASTRFGGGFTWADGQRIEPGTDNDKIRLDGTKIAPLKITGFIENDTTGWWRNRLQFLYVGDRNEFPDAPGPDVFAGFGQGEIDGYFLLSATSNIELGPGTLNVGVRNLLNREYKPAAAQAFNRPVTLSNGQGRTVTLGYELTW